MTPTSSIPARMDRRTALKWMMTAAASTALLDRTTATSLEDFFLDATSGDPRPAPPASTRARSLS